MERAELAAWLRLLESPGLGLESARRLLSAWGSPEAVLAASPAAWRQRVGPAQVQALSGPVEGLDELIERSWRWLDAQPGRSLLVLGDSDYPEPLLQTADPPLLLYLQGRRELLGSPALAVVGSRNPSAQGADNARQFARALGDAGLTIVSGLALGIDGAAHEGALESGGGTIAVLGTGLDRIYPARHRSLAERIARQGLLISEYALGTPPLAANFPRRNRIIAGLSRGCLVVEAALQSGSLITARLAVEAGREVFAIPGSIHSPQSRGCHALIRQGAKLVESAQDVLEELQLPAPGLPAAPAAGADLGGAPAADPGDAQARALLEALGFEPVSLEELQARCGWPTEQLTAMLLELELDGRVARLPGPRFQRRASA